MTPDEAREILEQFANATAEDDEEIYVWWLCQREIMGRPWRGEGPPSEEYLRKSARSKALAKLHAEIHIRKHTGQEWQSAQTESEALLEEIYQEAVATIETEGLPEAWKSARAN